MNKFKKGDVVQVISGREKSKQSKIASVFPESQTITLEDLNQKTHYVKKTQEVEGGLIKKPTPMPWAKVMVVCPSCKKPTRIGIKKTEKGNARYCKRCDKALG